MFQLEGSVFPQSAMVGVPCALIAAALNSLAMKGYIVFLEDEHSVVKNSQAWSGFGFLVGFLVVFRTSQAYSRFWDGCTATHQMRAECLTHAPL